MEANCVILDPINEDDEMGLESDQAIRLAAERYAQTIQKADELKVEAEDRLFSGSPGSIYLKRLGHRALTSDEKEKIIEAKGTQKDKEVIIAFSEAQAELSRRLKPISQHIRLVLDQAEVPYPNYYMRLKRPSLWKHDQMIRIIDVLARLQI